MEFTSDKSTGTLILESSSFARSHNLFIAIGGDRHARIHLAPEDSLRFLKEAERIVHGLPEAAPEPTPDQDRIEVLEDDVKYLTERLLVAQASITSLAAELTKLRTTLMAPKPSGLGSTNFEDFSGLGVTPLGPLVPLQETRPREIYLSNGRTYA